MSGNPAGRPKGSRNRVTALCADLLGDDAEDVMRTVIKRAKNGDGVALRLCVERLLPVAAARDRTVEFVLPDVAGAADIAQAAAAVVSHAASGDITLSEAGEFMRLLEVQRKILETGELTLRVEALERGGGSGVEQPGEDDTARIRVLVQEVEEGLRRRRW